MTAKVCDFCSSPDVRWAFRCPDFQATVLGFSADGRSTVRVPWGSHGGWAACPACKELICTGGRDVLARRSAKRLHKTYPSVSLAVCVKVVRSLHDLFFEYRMNTPPIPTTNKEHDLT